ncbi:MAG: hypothetical protein AAGE89_05830 [Pseudomonadota bacterium]
MAIIAVTVLVLGLICWLGQILVVFKPDEAVKFGLGEREEEVDRSMYLFERYSQGIPDIALTWILPTSALMMLHGIDLWPIFALIGGGIYLYFPPVFMITRCVLRKDGKKIGRPEYVAFAYILGILWLLSALFMIAFAVIELRASV